jgi:hypothetical protein
MANVELEDASFRQPYMDKTQNRHSSIMPTAPEITVHEAELTTYLECHYNELMATVDARRKPEYADQWEEI